MAQKQHALDQKRRKSFDITQVRVLLFLVKRIAETFLQSVVLVVSQHYVQWNTGMLRKASQAVTIVVFPPDQA